MDPPGRHRRAGGPEKFYDELLVELIAHAEHEFQLSIPDKHGVTQRQELEIAIEAGFAEAEELLGPPCPDGARYLLSWFAELGAVRSGNGFGPNPISYVEMDAWARLTGRHLAAFEVHALRKLDQAFLATARARAETPARDDKDG